MAIGQDNLSRDQVARWPRQDALRGLEWAFLLFVLLAAAYAFSLQARVQTLAWYLIYLSAAGFFVLRYGSLFSGLWLTGPILLWPVLAGLSFYWSENPGQTMRATIQLSMTVLIGAYLGARFSLYDICRALYWVLIVCGLASLLAILARMGFAFDHNGVPQGIFPHKNVLGGRMVLLLICAALLFFVGWNRLLSGATLILALALVAISQSATAILMTLGLGTLVPILLSWRSPAPLRVLSYLIALLMATLAVWIIVSFDIDPAGLTLEALGKERTLSGRSILWDFAVGQIELRPYVGAGFDGFWHGRDGSQSSYIQYVFGQDIVNFHNSYLDIAVQLGAAGLLLTLLTGVWFAMRVLGALRHGSNAITTLPAFLLAFVAVYSLSEYALFRQHSLIQLLLGAMAVASARLAIESRALDRVFGTEPSAAPSLRGDRLSTQ